LAAGEDLAWLSDLAGAGLVSEVLAGLAAGAAESFLAASLYLSLR
jgi:hypothetical protein